MQDQPSSSSGSSVGGSLLDDLQKQVTDLESRIRTLESRDNPITVREAMRVLEGHICLAIVGSKRKTREGLFTLKKVSQSTDATISNAYNSFMADRGLNEQHRKLLAYLKQSDLKDHGDSATHDQRPLLTASELLTMSYAEDDEEEDRLRKQNLFDLLDHFAPKDPQGRLVLTSPL